MTKFVNFHYVCGVFLSIIWTSFCLIFVSCRAIEKASGHVMLINQSEVAYGGILKELTPSVKIINEFEVTVIKCAIKHAVKKHPTTIPTYDSGKTVEPQVLNLQKLKLQATNDGQNRSYLVEVRVVDGQEQYHNKRIIYGITYSFCLTWNNTASSYKHNFVVSLDRGRNMFVFEHTFFQDKGMSLSATGDGSQQEGVTFKDTCVSSPVAVPPATDELSVCSQSEGLQGDNDFMSDQSQYRPSAGTENLSKMKTQKSPSDNGHKSETLKAKNGIKNSVSVVSYNIWNFNGVAHGETREVEAYIQRITRLGEIVMSTEADIFGFQEVRFDIKSGGRLGPCQVEHLAHHLPKYQYVFQPATAYVHDDLIRKEEGLAIFSLHPIVSHDFILLSRDMNDDKDNSHQRICLHAKVDTPSLGIVHVFVTHLSLSEAARARSVVEIWKYMSQFSGPAFLLGDMNAEPQSKSIRFLRGESEISDVKTEGLKDAWLMMNKEPRAGQRAYDKNEPRDHGLTFNAIHDFLVKRIDYIFMRLPDDMQMTDILLIDDGKRGCLAASDHLGLKVSIEGV